MLGLTSLQESWPVSGWILRLFVYIMERLKSTSKSPTIPGSRPGLLDTGPNLGPGSHGTDTPAANTPRQVRDGINTPNQQAQATSQATGNIFEDLDTFPEMFVPNMFLPDAYYEGHGVGQADFFDLLRVPDWDNMAISYSS